MRRYWFADREAIAAIRAAEDVAPWGDGIVPTLIFALDDSAFDSLEPLIGDGGAVQIADLRDDGASGAKLNAVLALETAEYLQISYHAIDDFGPALSLVAERLGRNKPAGICTGMHAISPYGVTQPERENVPPDVQCWVETGALRNTAGHWECPTVEALRGQYQAYLNGLEPDVFPASVGAYYLTCAEQEPLEPAAREAALWRARSAAAWAEIDRLKSERRVRAGREAALAARHERTLARQAERTRREINRLYRAAGWAGRWRARLTGLFGR